MAKAPMPTAVRSDYRRPDVRPPGIPVRPLVRKVPMTPRGPRVPKATGGM